MLNSEVIRKIEEFVYQKPRSIQEIASHIEKNWRTADRYIERIIKDFGTIETRTFRKGTRGALKIVYWASVEKRNQSVFQEELEKRIFSSTKKEDFSAFDIFQHISNNKKEAYAKKAINEVTVGRLDELRKFLLNTQKQILFFSGNLSFINYKDNQGEIFEILDNLVKRGVKMKVLCRVDISGKENIERLLSLNHKYGKELIEIRHREQPLRLTVIDSKMFNMKDIINPSTRIKELNKKVIVFYTIKDKKWVEWVSNIFFRMFNNSILAERRLEEMNKIRINL
jgi:hypothetical protein